MSCYLATLKQTDDLLKQITQLLQSQGSYSLLYLSDHGLSHTRKESDTVSLIHNNKSKQNYHVPFVVLSSDDTQQHQQQAARSGFDFIQGFAEWLGIEESSLKKDYRFFSETPMTEELKIFDWTQQSSFNNLDNDEALMP